MRMPTGSAAIGVTRCMPDCGVSKIASIRQGSSGVRDGFCSFFLLCPAGCTLRCWLWAGRWKREARSEPTGKPEMLGRVNFARFENCVDPTEEFVDLAVEIEEAQMMNGRPTGSLMPPGSV